MRIKFEVKMTKQAMHEFLVYHTYSHASGIAGIIFGIITVGFAVINTVRGNYNNALIMAIFAGIFLIYMPFSLNKKAEAQAKNAMFSKPLEYEISEEGIGLTQGEESCLNPWETFRKVRSTKNTLILYLTTVRALVIPKQDVGADYEEFVAMVKQHLTEKQVRIK